MRVQGAQAIGEFLRQHRHHKTGEVHGVAALVRFFIQRCIHLHIVRDIGDRHPQTPATGGLVAFTVNRIVKVTGVFTVDGDERQMAQINAQVLIRLGHLIWHGGGLSRNLFGPFVRNVMAADGNVDLHTRGQVLTQYFCDFAHRQARPGRLAGDVHYDKLTVLCAVATLRWHQHFQRNAFIIGVNRAHTGFFKVTPNDLSGVALQHFENLTLWATTAIQPQYLHSHFVTVEDFAHLTVGEIDIIAIVLQHKAEAVAVTRHHAFFQVGFFQRHKLIAAVTQQLTIAAHGDQTAAQGLNAIFVGFAQLAHDFFVCERFVGLFQQHQQGFAAGHRVLILLCFEFSVGVLDRRSVAAGIAQATAPENKFSSVYSILAS